MLRDAMLSANTSDTITIILMFVLSILLTTLILRLLWNNSLVKHITILKPLSTFTDALLLAISLSVLRGLY